MTVLAILCWKSVEFAVFTLCETLSVDKEEVVETAGADCGADALLACGVAVHTHTGVQVFEVVVRTVAQTSVV